jgi:aspartate racemase
MKEMIIALLATVLSAQSVPGNKPALLPPASDMKRLGLVGGTSWYSTVDYYRYINKAVNDAYGDNTNPPLIIFNLNQQKIHELQAQNQWRSFSPLSMSGDYRDSACYDLGRRFRSIGHGAVKQPLRSA